MLSLFQSRHAGVFMIAIPSKVDFRRISINIVSSGPVSWLSSASGASISSAAIGTINVQSDKSSSCTTVV